MNEPLYDINQHNDTATLATIRVFLLILFLFGLLGAGTELLLLEHTENFWQRVPLFLMAASLLVLGCRIVARGSTSMRIFQGIMLLFVISGFVGQYQHYQGNVEFELEMYPAMQGFELFREAMTGATPALAPGTMIVLGLIGLAYTYRHPALVKSIGK